MSPLPLLLTLACAASPQDTAPGCQLRSTAPDYVPACDAVLAHFAEESRLLIDGRLEAYLPPSPQPDTTYGGLSGNPLTILLDGSLAHQPDTTLTLGPDGATVHLDAVFDEGTVTGIVSVRVVDGS